MNQEEFVRLARQFVYSNPNLTLGQLYYRVRDYAKIFRDPDTFVSAIFDSKMFVVADDGHVSLTEDEQIAAEHADLTSIRTLARWSPCSGCIRLQCVCEASLACMNRGMEHSVGCHGSHD